MFPSTMRQLLGRYLPDVLSEVSPEYPALNVWEDDDRFYAEADGVPFAVHVEVAGSGESSRLSWSSLRSRARRLRPYCWSACTAHPPAWRRRGLHPERLVDTAGPG